MQYDLTPSCMKATRDVTAKFCRQRRILWVSEQLCSVSRLILGILHFYYAFLIYKYTMYNIPEMTWVPITSTLRFKVLGPQNVLLAIIYIHNPFTIGGWPKDRSVQNRSEFSRSIIGPSERPMID